MKNYWIFAFLAVASVNAAADGIDCSTLPDWSDPIDGYQVNQHHIFCGEAGRGSSAKGFHSMPKGEKPSDFISAEGDGSGNSAGIYKLRKIKLRFDGSVHTKTFSTMFPDHCTQAQVNNSIVYASTHSHGSCADPGWAKCGPNAPSGGSGDTYCQGNGGNAFDIATAVLSSGSKKINTGFPIFRP